MTAAVGTAEKLAGTADFDSRADFDQRKAGDRGLVTRLFID
jgi:hypothetical protein